MSMLSRVANNIYWMARYLERAENTARLINVNSHLMMDLPNRMVIGWEPLVDIVSDRTQFHSLYDKVDESSVVQFLVADKKHGSSITSSLHAARENARTIREIIPREVWEQINSLYIGAKTDSSQALSRGRRYEFLNRIILGNQTISGLLSGTMTHDEGYSFLQLGRNIERADMTTRIIDVRSASLLPDLENDLSAFENIQWMGVLKSLTAYQMYRREMRLRISRPDVLKFLFQESRFPRAIFHAVNQVKQCLEQLPRHSNMIPDVVALQKMLMDTKPEGLQQQQLHEFIDQLQLSLVNVHTSIDDTYF